jgi:hypothetical protein
VSAIAPRRSEPRAAAAGTAAVDGCAEVRCGCGSLLARRVPGGVELKCRRCKRTVVVPLAEDDET